jgi:integrase
MTGTVNRELATVIAVLNLAARLWMWIPQVPLIQRVEGPRKKPYPLSWKEQDRLFDVLPDHLRWAALFKVNTGLREQELCSLTWDMEVAIDELKTSAFVLQDKQTKNGEERLVVLNSEARRVIEAQRGKHETFVFTYQRGKENPVRPLRGLENNAWRKAWRKAKLPVDALTLRGVHNLRHTFGHRLRSAGVSLEDRKDLLGHKSTEVTTLYSLADIARLIEFVERITVRKQTFMLRPVRQSTADLADSRI